MYTIPSLPDKRNTNKSHLSNPWYLITLGAAEFLYDAVAAWTKQSQITVDSTSLAFFQEIYPEAQAQTYTSNTTSAFPQTYDTSAFSQILAATSAYADSFVAVAQQYTPANGSLSEQFNRTLPGNPISAYDLTWSYASFVTMAQRRAGEFPRSWTTTGTLPATCSASAQAGVYAPATAAGAPDVTAESLCTSTVRFEVNATTYFGENIVLVGDTPELGSWNPANSQAMSASQFTADRPLWFVEVALAAGETVSYTYARQQNCDQGYVYETVNRTLVAPACVSNGTAEQVLLETDDAFTGPDGTWTSC